MILTQFRLLFLICLLVSSCASIDKVKRQIATTVQVAEGSARQVIVDIQQFAGGKKVVTITGYSFEGYQDISAVLNSAVRILDKYNPETHIINLGHLTGDDLSIYSMAKSRGFTTIIILSSAAINSLSSMEEVDMAFVVKDKNLGGFIESTKKLSATSQAIVASSDIIYALGGGEIVYAELREALSLDKEIYFTSMEVNHNLAKQRAEEQGYTDLQNYKGKAEQLKSKLKPF